MPFSLFRITMCLNNNNNKRSKGTSVNDLELVKFK